MENTGKTRGEKMIKIGNFTIRPEIEKPLYWVHILILAILVQIILGFFGHDTGGIFTIHTLYFALAIAGSDIVAHSLLKLD